MRKTLLSIITVAGLSVSLSALATGCKQNVAASPQNVAASPQATTASEPAKAKAAAAKSKIATIVFVGKQDACDCTRKRIEDSWAALQKALGTPAILPVERFQIDIDVIQVEPYKQQKAMVTLPAIYFVNDEANVLELLQGEVTEQQIQNVLKYGPEHK